MVGTTLGPYTIVAKLGAGGMGEVYRARDARLGRDVAVKILPPSVATDADRLARFEREARMLAALNHPNVAAIHGIEQVDGVLALVLEFVEGRTLAALIERTPAGLPLDRMLALARQIASALEAAHERGIVHRDLKPSNIVVTDADTVKVLDFGLAKIAGREMGDVAASSLETMNATREGVVVGTAAYMSPEQARGQAIDKRTDIWAFGCVAYEMLTGKSPFGRATIADTLAAVVNATPDWALCASAPAAVSRLLQRCLQKDARQRLHDIADARIEIDELIASKQLLTPLGSVREARAAMSLAGAAVLAFAALGLGAAVATLVMTNRQTPLSGGAPPDALAAQLTNYGTAETSPAISPDGRSFAFVSAHGGTTDIWLRQVAGGDPIRLTNDDAEERDTAFSPDGESIYFARPDRDTFAIWNVGVLGGHARKVVDGGSAPAVSPDGKMLAFFSGGVGGEIRIVPLTGGTPRTLASNQPSGARPAWSPDGRRIAYGTNSLFGPADVYVIDVDTGNQRRVARFPLAAAVNDGGRPVWLADNRHLVVSYLSRARQQGPGDLGIVDVETGQIVRLTMNVGDGLYSPSVSADGTRLVATKQHFLEEIWKVPLGPDPDENGRKGVRLLDEAAGPLWMFVSRDGRTILFNSPLSGSRNLWTMPAAGGAPHQVTTIPGDAVSHSSLSPDGSRVAFASIAAGHSDIWTARIDGSDLRQLTNDEEPDSWPIWSPDGEWIAYQTFRGNTRQSWRVPASGGAPEKMLDDLLRGDWIRNPRGSGTLIATSINGIQLLDVEKRAVIWDVRSPGFGLSLPMFSPDGLSISTPFREGLDHDVIRVFDTATGASRVAVRLPFHVAFRAAWVDEGRALVVNRNDPVSHIVLLDHFWPPAK